MGALYLLRDMIAFLLVDAAAFYTLKYYKCKIPCICTCAPEETESQVSCQDDEESESNKKICRSKLKRQSCSSASLQSTEESDIEKSQTSQTKPCPILETKNPKPIKTCSKRNQQELNIVIRTKAMSASDTRNNSRKPRRCYINLTTKNLSKCKVHNNNLPNSTNGKGASPLEKQGQNKICETSKDSQGRCKNLDAKKPLKLYSCRSSSSIQSVDSTDFSPSSSKSKLKRPISSRSTETNKKGPKKLKEVQKNRPCTTSKNFWMRNVCNNSKSRLELINVIKSELSKGSKESTSEVSPCPLASKTSPCKSIVPLKLKKKVSNGIIYPGKRNVCDKTENRLKIIRSQDTKGSKEGTSEVSPCLSPSKTSPCKSKAPLKLKKKDTNGIYSRKQPDKIDGFNSKKSRQKRFKNLCKETYPLPCINTRSRAARLARQKRIREEQMRHELVCKKPNGVICQVTRDANSLNDKSCFDSTKQNSGDGPIDAHLYSLQCSFEIMNSSLGPYGCATDYMIPAADIARSAIERNYEHISEPQPFQLNRQILDKNISIMESLDTNNPNGNFSINYTFSQGYSRSVDINSNLNRTLLCFENGENEGEDSEAYSKFFEMNETVEIFKGPNKNKVKYSTNVFRKKSKLRCWTTNEPNIRSRRKNFYNVHPHKLSDSNRCHSSINSDECSEGVLAASHTFLMSQKPHYQSLEDCCKNALSKASLFQGLIEFLKGKLLQVTPFEESLIEQKAQQVWIPVCFLKNDMFNELPLDQWAFFEQHLKIAFIWAVMTGENSQGVPFGNFLHFYKRQRLANGPLREPCQTLLFHEATNIWDYLDLGERLPFILEAFMYRVERGYVDINDGKVVRKILNTLSDTV